MRGPGPPASSRSRSVLGMLPLEADLSHDTRGLYPGIPMALTILFLAPQPFYQERGTPIAVRLLLRALSERGDRVELLTFPEGEDIELPRLTIHRIDPRPRVQGVRPGFSWKKVYSDCFLAADAFRLTRRVRPDVIHATEEGVFLARAMERILGVPFVYDMDSSMSDQIADRFPALRVLRRVFESVEAGAVRRARAVVPMCDALADVARRYGAEEIVVLKDVSLLGSSQFDGGPGPKRSAEAPAPVPTPVLRLRDAPALAQGIIVLYVGNLEAYQGIDLLLESFDRARRVVPEARLAVAGGVPAHVEHYRRRAEQLDLGEVVRFLGPQPVGHLGALLEQADLLVSPRTLGQNTPMKLYTYLDSGVAVLATDLPTHTQVVTAREAGLAAPEPEAFAREMVGLLRDPARRAALASAARDLVRREHSYDSFRARVHDLYGRLEAEIVARRAARPTDVEG